MRAHSSRRGGARGDDEIVGACELLDQAASAIESLREVSDAFDGMAEQAEEVRLLAADLRDSVASQGDNHGLFSGGA